MGAGWRIAGEGILPRTRALDHIIVTRPGGTLQTNPVNGQNQMAELIVTLMAVCLLALVVAYSNNDGNDSSTF